MFQHNIKISGPMAHTRLGATNRLNAVESTMIIATFRLSTARHSSAYVLVLCGNLRCGPYLHN